MLINGEKYACEACVRGHRVSSCSHSDRKLLHVNKKGRPVSQCQHCRTLRKARSQHVKCECHDKAHAKEDCPHLKSESALLALESVPAAAPNGGQSSDCNTCCCGHGARCTCSLKKDHLDTVPEDFPQVLHPKEPQHKHRISSLNNHEGKPTVFTNGHHKPVHKINDAHNHCGAPYRVPSRSHTTNGHRDNAQRSTDSLPIIKSPFKHNESSLHSSVTSAPREARKAKSEHNSPELGPANSATDQVFKELYIPPLSPNAYSYSPFDDPSPTFPTGSQQELHLPENIPDSWFTTYDEAHAFDAIPAARFTDTPPIDWSSFDFSKANINPNHNSSFSPVGNDYRNSPTSFAAPFDHRSFGGLPRMNSSSGEISEADDSMVHNRPSNLRTVSNASNDLSSPGDDFSENHRLSSTSSIFGTPQANILAGTLDNLDIDEYVKRTVAEQKRLDSQTSISLPSQINESPSPLVGDFSQPQRSPEHFQPSANHGHPTPPRTESPQPLHKTSMGYIMPTNPYGPEHAFTISEAQAYAHMADDVTEKSHDRSSPLARTSLTQDPMWSGSADGISAFKLDDPKEDEDWVR